MRDLYRLRVETHKQAGTYRTLNDLCIQGKYVEIKGERLLNLSGNDYLGLQDLPELRQEFLDSGGSSLPFSSSSSRLLSGNDETYCSFEKYLKELYSAPTSLVWDSGFHANSGIIPVLGGKGVFFLLDRLVHASIIEGVKLSGSDFARFRHNDVGHLDELISRYAAEYDAIWVVTESVFSMDGDLAPLHALATLKERYPNLYLYVDEAHAMGVFGHGLGRVAELGLQSHIDLLIGTLGKGLSSVGAFSLQSSELRDLFVSSSRPFIYSTALPPIMIAWSHFLLKKVVDMEERRTHLRTLMAQLNPDLQSPIWAVILPDTVNEAVETLLEKGFFVRSIRKPTVPVGTERIRLSLTAAMSVEEVIRLREVIGIFIEPTTNQ